MYKILGYAEDGTPIYGNMYGQPFTPNKDVVITAKKNTATKWYEGLFNNAGGILAGAGSLISSIKGNPANVTYVNTPDEEPKSKDNTIIYAAIAVIGLILIFFFLNKK